MCEQSADHIAPRAAEAAIARAAGVPGPGARTPGRRRTRPSSGGVRGAVPGTTTASTGHARRGGKSTATPERMRRAGRTERSCCQATPTCDGRKMGTQGLEAAAVSTGTTTQGHRQHVSRHTRSLGCLRRAVGFGGRVHSPGDVTVRHAKGQCAQRWRRVPHTRPHGRAARQNDQCSRAWASQGDSCRRRLGPPVRPTAGQMSAPAGAGHTAADGGGSGGAAGKTTAPRARAKASTTGAAKSKARPKAKSASHTAALEEIRVRRAEAQQVLKALRGELRKDACRM